MAAFEEKVVEVVVEVVVEQEEEVVTKEGERVEEAMEAEKVVVMEVVETVGVGKWEEEKDK